MTTYLLSVYHGDAIEAPADLDMTQVFADVAAFNAGLQESGAWVFAGGLMPAHTASVVDATAGEPNTSAGPLLAGPQYMGGFWVINAADDAAAREWAAKGSAACRLPVEVRPFQPDV